MSKMLMSLAFFVALSAQAVNGGQTASEVRLPPPLNEERDLISRYWVWLKQEADAPAGLPWPNVDIEPLPRTVRMAFFFPTEISPSTEIRIALSPRSVDRASGPERLTVLGELAHELTHYVLLLSENDWNLDAKVFRNEIHHHCDPEFARLTRQMAEFIWQTYHSNDAVRSIDHMVHLACWRDGHNIAETASR